MRERSPTALVIGHGRMGRNHARALRSLGFEVSTVDPVAVADFATHRDAPPADVAVIATPVGELSDLARWALESGMHVLVEKPAGATVTDIRFAAAAVRHDRILGVGFTERHNPAMRLYRATQHQRPAHLEFRRHGPAPDRPTAGIVLDLMVHDLDLLRWLGYQPAVLSARATPTFASAHLALGHGATASLTVSYQAPLKVRTFTAFEDEATITVDLQQQTVTRQNDVCCVLGRLAKEPLVAQWEDFLAAIREGRDPEATASDAIAALLLVHDVERLAVTAGDVVAAA